MNTKIVQNNKNILLYGLLFCVVLVVILITSCGWLGMKMVKDALTGSLQKTGVNYVVFKQCLKGVGLSDMWDRVMGNKKYLVLLLNNTEIRPGGGFMGSYVKVKMSDKGIESYEVKDIYDPDGQIVGHVEPPYPIQEAFGQGWWRLRDANWDVDFAASAATINWFMEQGGEVNVDGIVAVNLDLLEKWVEVVGEVRPVTLNEVVNKDNLYSLAQKYSEVEGKKENFLGTVGTALVEQTKNLEGIKLVKLARLFNQEVKQGEIMMWFKDGRLQTEVEKWGWAGKLDKGWENKSDYLYVVDANLGANKANAYVKRTIQSEVNGDGDGWNRRVIVDWKNESEFSMPNGIDYWGGDYLNYVRVVVPKTEKLPEVRVGERELTKMKSEMDIPNSLREEISENEYSIEERNGLWVVGFWVKVKAGQEERAVVDLGKLTTGKKNYQVFVKRQAGMGAMNYTLTINGKNKFKGVVEADRIVK